jgi:hypothetical protein
LSSSERSSESLRRISSDDDIVSLNWLIDLRPLAFWNSTIRSRAASRLA